MQRVATQPSILSLSLVFRSSRPKRVIADRLVQLLRSRLREHKIVWNPSAFRGGLTNPKLPPWLLEKLESLLALAEASGWRLSKVLRDELDATVEDIESFNPPFQAALKKASRDARAGRLVTQDVLERRCGVRR